MSEAKKKRTKYRTTNWKAYNAALKARGALTMWLDRDMQWLAAPSGKRGRRQTFSDAAIQFCLSIKCLFGQALRQTLGLVESLLRLAGLDWPVPDYSTVCRRQKTLQAQITYRPSAERLQLVVDGSRPAETLRRQLLKVYDCESVQIVPLEGASCEGLVRQDATQAAA